MIARFPASGADETDLLNTAWEIAARYFGVAPERITLSYDAAVPAIVNGDGTILRWSADIEAEVKDDPS